MDDVTPERWLPVVGLEGKYEVSSLGRVRSVDRVTNGRRIAGRMMRVRRHEDMGYLTVHFKVDGKAKGALVRILVATAFLGPCPEHHVVRERDGDPANCTLANLYYGTHARLFVQPGQRIGYGVVIDPEIYIEAPGRKGMTRAARLLCDCGNEYVQLISGLVGARVRRLSCGCMTKRLQAQSAERARGAQHAAGLRPRFVDRTGQRYGNLVAVRVEEATSGDTRWLCRCDCGNEVSVGTKGLVRGTTVSCGCRWRQRPGVLAPGMAARNSVLAAYRASARSRAYCWELSDDEFDRLTAQDCFYCGAAPGNVAKGNGRAGDFTYNGIDRVHNDLGYTPENVVTACRICNVAKRDMPYDEFKAWLGRLTGRQLFSPEHLPSGLIKAVLSASVP